MHAHQSHLDDSDLLLALDRELAPRRQTRADRHLGECAACRSRQSQLQRTGDTATDLYRATTPARWMAASRTRLSASLAEPAPPPSIRWCEGRRAPLTALPTWSLIAATVLTAALLVRVASSSLNPAIDFERLGGVERGTLPLAGLTPGATWSVGVDELCAPGAREQRSVPASVRREVLRGYRMERVPPDQYELDYLITPDLGGAPDVRNLWPQRYGSEVWNARVKDQLEQLLPRLVCSGAVDLETAQRDIASDWVAAYRKYFKSDLPVNATAGRLATAADLDHEENEDVYPVWRSRGALTLVAFSARR